MTTNVTQPIPAHSVGIGLKPIHYRDALARPAGVDFFEVHAENFMGAGGPPHAWLAAIRETFPLSVHGVCLSLGGLDPLDRDHLMRLKKVVDRHEPALISEHLAWCARGGAFFNDLLAAPLSKETFERVVAHVDETQSVLGRRILVENPSQYLKTDVEIPEPAFLNELARRTGCGLLLDVNNVFVSASNLGFDSQDYLDTIEPDHVGEIHLAGHAIDRFGDLEIRVDNHGSKVCAEVATLYRRFIERAGPRSTLVEWDTNVPEFATLAAEAARARAWMESALRPKAAKEAAHV